jgi:hypothetical protein
MQQFKMPRQKPESESRPKCIKFYTKFPPNSDLKDKQEKDIRDHVQYCVDIDREVINKTLIFKEYFENNVDKFEMKFHSEHFDASFFMHPLSVEYFSRLLESHAQSPFSSCSMYVWRPFLIKEYIKEKSEELGPGISQAAEIASCIVHLFRDVEPYSMSNLSPTFEIIQFSKHHYLPNISNLLEHTYYSRYFTTNMDENCRKIDGIISTPNIAKQFVCAYLNTGTNCLRQFKRVVYRDIFAKALKAYKALRDHANKKIQADNSVIIKDTIEAFSLASANIKAMKHFVEERIVELEDNEVEVCRPKSDPTKVNSRYDPKNPDDMSDADEEDTSVKGKRSLLHNDARLSSRTYPDDIRRQVDIFFENFNNLAEVAMELITKLRNK